MILRSKTTDILNNALVKTSFLFRRSETWFVSILFKLMWSLWLYFCNLKDIGKHCFVLILHPLQICRAAGVRRTSFGNLLSPLSFYWFQVNGCLAEVGRPHKISFQSSAQNHMGKMLKRECWMGSRGCRGLRLGYQVLLPGSLHNFAFTQFHKESSSKT